MHTNKTITKYGAKYLFALPEQANALDRFVDRHEEKILAAGGVVIFSIMRIFFVQLFYRLGDYSSSCSYVRF